MVSRRQFFALAGTSAVGVALLFSLEASIAKKAIALSPYGPLQRDPKGVLDLPAGFSYVRLSETGQTMSDGYRVPGGHDGMAAFAGPNGTTLLIRNHELTPTSSTQVSAPKDQKYDTQGKGGCTKLVITRDRRLVEHYGVLAGTYRNCAGGPTPWGSWLSCEESLEVGNQKHGYVFEVASTATDFVKAAPLTAMGRFNHEAAAVDPKSGYVYQTEDRGDGLLYRFVPSQRGNLRAGGSLYALRIANMPGVNTKTDFPPNRPQAVEWVKIDNPDPETDTVRFEGQSKGAARFARGEGIWYGDRAIYFCCTSGGSSEDGQVWRYKPANETLELYLEPNHPGVLDNIDNIVVAPNGDLFLCEDGDGSNCVVGITRRGTIYQLARNTLNGSELAGACFSPDGKIMFVNMQTPGITFAIAGPW